MRYLNHFRYYSRRLRAFHISTYAASASFFMVIAIFPLLMVVLSALRLARLDPMEFMEMISLVLPRTFRPMVQGLTADLLDASSATATVSLSLSLVVTLWTASKSMLGLLDGLNAIADVNNTRGFFHRRLLCMGYMLLLIAVLMINLALLVFGRHIYSVLQFSFPALGRFFYLFVDRNGLTIFVAMAVVFLLIYAVFPNKKMPWLRQLPGALFTALGWTVFSELFSAYVNNADRLSALYGGLTTVVIAMLWLYFCMYILFFGAVINRCFPDGIQMLRGCLLRRKQNHT